MSNKRVYLFREASADMRDLLGGKGANLGEMTKIGLSVPAGFTITTATCNEYYDNNRQLPGELMNEVRTAMTDIESQMGKTFGGSEKPLLVSVRSGAKFSMPGMMDTVLNLGLNETTVQAMISETGDARFVYDSYRRLIMMLSDVAFGLSKHHFDNEIFAEYKKKVGAKLDTELTAEHLKEICGLFLDYVQSELGRSFPSDPWEQLEVAVEAVFKSWNNDRAIVYRKQERIPAEIGTAVTVQSMVFGNAGDDCGTGVAFTRDPSTGERTLYGEYLMNAQGEDVVAGVRTPVPIETLKEQNPEVFDEFIRTCKTLEGHYKDLQDLEFTIEHGKLYMLQCRSGKRTGPAAVRLAVEMVHENLISREDALMRITGSHLDQLLHPRINPDALETAGLLTQGLAASPGAAVGRIVFDADSAADRGAQGGLGENVILVREETTPDDVHGMLASQGILTARGGKTSHAAVVARGFGIPCVAGAEEIEVDIKTKHIKVGNHVLHDGDMITLDGSTGKIYIGELDLIAPEVGGHFGELMEWADELRQLKIRTNADNPRDSQQAIDFGAEGIGLCRTEHMFFETDRLPLVQELILTKDESTRQEMLDKLETIQQKDFEGIFEVMDGKPVTIRLIDPPLHEFLPSHEELLKEVTSLEFRSQTNPELRTKLDDRRKLLHEVEGMKEANPMMGLRGVRLSIILPGLVVMQTRAILQAAAAVMKSGKIVLPEIMIPLVSTVNELKVVQGQLESAAQKVVEESGMDIPYMFGTMIEIPRAALTAGEIAEFAEFFSFGTNDLTQMTFGYSRDDAEGKFLQTYVDQKILPVNPFETIDRSGIGRLMKIATDEGKESRSNLKCGICGEHGGDPESIYLCHEIGLDYVSCSPFRVPIARLAAAQAVIREKKVLVGSA